MSEFYRKVEIGSLTKTEYDKYGVLRVPVTFKVLTPWYKPEPIEVGFSTEEENAFLYDVSSYPAYPDQDTEFRDGDLIYAMGSSDFTAKVEANGHIPAAMKLTFKGTVVTPKIRLIGKLTRKTYGECDINVNFSSSETLVFSTEYQNSYVKKIDYRGNEINLINDIDITKDPFFHIPIEEACELIISGRTLEGTASLEVYDYYRAV